MQRRVDEPDDDRQAVHRAEEAGEVIGLELLELGESRVERGDRLALVVGAIRIGLVLGRRGARAR